MTSKLWVAMLVVATVFIVSAVAFAYAQSAQPPTSPSIHTEDIADFCDSSAGHGSSTSCKEEAEFVNYQCQSGTFSGRGSCSTPSECTENGAPGHTCDCTAKCVDA